MHNKTRGSNEVRHARENIARRESVGQKSEIVSIDFRAVAPKAGRILDGDDVIDGVRQRCLLDGCPRQPDKDVSRAIDLQRTRELTKRTLDLQEMGSAHDSACLQDLARLLAHQGGVATREQLRDPPLHSFQGFAVFRDPSRKCPVINVTSIISRMSSLASGSSSSSTTLGATPAMSNVRFTVVAPGA
jgi:hypothetical protein